jgi:hypothetical protein
VCNNVARRGNLYLRLIFDGMEQLRLNGGIGRLEVRSGGCEIGALWTIRKTNGSGDIVQLCIGAAREDQLASLLLESMQGRGLRVAEHTHIGKNQRLAGES